jgi:hypothetical protein
MKKRYLVLFASCLVTMVALSVNISWTTTFNGDITIDDGGSLMLDWPGGLNYAGSTSYPGSISEKTKLEHYLDPYGPGSLCFKEKRGGK